MNIYSPYILLLTIYSTISTLVPNRTGSLSLRRRTLYPIELRGHRVIYYIINLDFNQLPRPRSHLQDHNYCKRDDPCRKSKPGTNNTHFNYNAQIIRKRQKKDPADYHIYHSWEAGITRTGKYKK